MEDASSVEAKKSLLDGLLVVWKSCPVLRLGQLVVNAAKEMGKDPYYIEDSDLAWAFGKFLIKRIGTNK